MKTWMKPLITVAALTLVVGIGIFIFHDATLSRVQTKLEQHQAEAARLQARINEITQLQSEASRQREVTPRAIDPDPEFVAEIQEKRAEMVDRAEQLEAAGNHGPAAAIRQNLNRLDHGLSEYFNPNPEWDRLAARIQELAEESRTHRNELAIVEAKAEECERWIAERLSR